MSNFNFEGRDGSTPIDLEQRRGLKYSHVTNLGELDELEDKNIQAGLAWLYAYKKDDYFSVLFLNKLHKKLFGDVWEWAGKYRTIEIPRNLSPFHFTQVPEALKNLFLDFEARQNVLNIDWEEWAAEFHHRLVSIHPYPNGNGRTTRIYLEYVQKRKGQSVTSWSRSLKQDAKKRRLLYLKALRAADGHDYAPLIEFMREKI